MINRSRIGRQKYTLTLNFANNATTISVPGNDNGVLMSAIITTPATVDTSATMTTNVLDSDSNVVYTKTGVAANTTSINLLTSDLRVPLCGPYTVQVVYSASQTANRVATVALLIDRG